MEEMQEQEKRYSQQNIQPSYYTWREVADRYGLGERNARELIMIIRSLIPNGGMCKPGKIMPFECDEYDRLQRAKLQREIDKRIARLGAAPKPVTTAADENEKQETKA